MNEKTSNPKNDPLVRAARKAYLGSNQHRLDKLRDRRSKLQRKVTFYSNLLADTDTEIREWLAEFVAKNPGERSTPLHWIAAELEGDKP